MDRHAQRHILREQERTRQPLERAVPGFRELGDEAFVIKQVDDPHGPLGDAAAGFDETKIAAQDLPGGQPGLGDRAQPGGAGRAASGLTHDAYGEIHTVPEIGIGLARAANRRRGRCLDLDEAEFVQQMSWHQNPADAIILDHVALAIAGRVYFDRLGLQRH